MNPAFSEWLRAAVPSDVTWRTKMSEVNRLERTYGDLDALFDADGLEGLMSELAYSAVDKRNKETNPSQLLIDGDLYNNLSSYRSAARKYQLFREELISQPDTHVVDVGNVSEAASLSFKYEQDLQTALIACIGQLEKGMSLADNGKEYAVPTGRIDALARDASNALVVIELKAVTAKRDVLGQVAGYMADIEDETGARPRGILIAPDFDPKLLQAARMVPGLTLMRYTFSFEFSGVS